ncbi:MAG: hypothetical protein HPY52_15770 [Firmicutes bacterium]|nr:hypothetical protein [Bacillota bacterium]
MDERRLPFNAPDMRAIAQNALMDVERSCPLMLLTPAAIRGRLKRVDLSLPRCPYASYRARI